jgi:hypothetical protein
MPIYWVCYRHNNQISVVIEPGAPPIDRRLDPARWYEAAHSAAYACQCAALRPKPWQPVPANEYVAVAIAELCGAMSRQPLQIPRLPRVAVPIRLPVAHR